MIIIGLGSNLPGAKGEPPEENVQLSLSRLQGVDIKVVAVSPFYKREPVPKSDQPWFVNAVAALETRLEAAALLKHLHSIESSFGRTRRIQNEARVLDLDLLDYNGRVTRESETGVILPHPRMHSRAFVLKPLANIAPDWRHPTLGQSAVELLDALSSDGRMIPL